MSDGQAERRRASARRMQPGVEIRLCVLLLSARWHNDALEQAHGFIENERVDWDALIRLAEREQISPLLYQIARDAYILPQGVLQQCRAAHLANGARNALCFHGLERILALLARAQIPVILLKGAALAASVYESQALRPMGDIDLLIPRSDAIRAHAMLESVGYAPVSPPQTAEIAPGIENELAMRRDDGPPALVELHWSLFDSPYYQRRLATDWLWDSAIPTRIGHTGALVLGPEAQLIHLCGHLLLHHQGRGLLWQHDIAAWMAYQRDIIDWGSLLARAQQFDLVLPIQHTIPHIAAEWLAPIPEEVLTRLCALEPTQEERRIFHWLTVGQSTVARHLWTDLKSMSSWPERLSYGLGSLFPSPRYMIERYNIPSRALVPLYYPYRWLLGLRRGRHRTK